LENRRRGELGYDCPAAVVGARSPASRLLSVQARCVQGEGLGVLRQPWKQAEQGLTEAAPTADSGAQAAVGRARGAVEEWFIYSREVGWELVGSSRRSEHARCGRQCPATCDRPAANGARRAVRRRVWPHRLAPPAAVDVMHRSTPAQRSDQWAFWPLGMRAQRRYGAYGGVPTWPRAMSRQSALRRSKAISIR
jgi:hypothetical protein